MNDIPFLAQLGDAFETAIAAGAPRRHRFLRRRIAVPALAVAAVLTLAAIAVARLATGSDELAATGIACYAQPGSSDVTIVESHGSPVRACADALRRAGVAVESLVACAAPASVAVIPGRDEQDCTRAGLRPLPSGYRAANARTARLQAAVLSLEAQQDCIAPGQLARQVQRLLDRGGWTGWKTKLSPGGASGPCGTVTGLDGSGHRTIGGALVADRHVVLVARGAARSTMALLYGPQGIAAALEDASGTRCLSVAEVRSLVAARSDGRSVAVLLDHASWNAPGVTVADARWGRFRAGCAVLEDIRAASDGRNLVAVIPVRS